MFFLSKIYAEEFLYPVAHIDNGEQLLLLYQKSLQNIELWIFDTTSHQAIKGISSFSTPANLRIMPSGNGFSFIDQGYIKIKEFMKRSAKTISINEPIGLFSHMNWINEDLFYFVAKEGDFFQIFQSNTQADVTRLTNLTADALYPQKIGNTLFFMQRDNSGKISIMQQPWTPVPMNESKNIGKTQIIQESDQQLCYLHMISDVAGFYIQAPHKKAHDTDCYEFFCYQLKKEADRWENQQLFSFMIPSKYLIGAARLHESIEPFLPNYVHHNSIYFVSWDQNSMISPQFELYHFDCASHVISNQSHLITKKYNNHMIFAPYIHEDILYCGLITMNNDEHKKYTSIQDNSIDFDMNEGTFEIPKYRTKK